MNNPHTIMDRKLIELAKINRQLASANRRTEAFRVQMQMANIILNDLRKINGRYK